MASPSATSYFAQGDESDYGSDFSPDEEALVEKLITAALLKDPAPLQDIEDIIGFTSNNRIQDASTTSMRRSPRLQSGKNREIQYPVLSTSESADEDDPMDLAYPAKTPKSKFASIAKSECRLFCKNILHTTD